MGPHDAHLKPKPMTDHEQAVREIIADVRALRDEPDDFDNKLAAIERKLGGLLPPIGGKFNISLDTVLKPR